jgi:WD40 repeat protein
VEKERGQISQDAGGVVKMKRNRPIGLHRFLCAWSLLFFGFAGIPLTSAQDHVRRPDNGNDPPPKMGLVRDLGLSADGKLAFAADVNGVIWVWDLGERKVLRAIKVASNNREVIANCAFSADGKFAVVGYQPGLGGYPFPPNAQTLTFWDLNAGVKVRTFELKGDSVQFVALTPDGNRAVSLSHWKTIFNGVPGMERWYNFIPVHQLCIWDTSTGKLLRRLLEDAPYVPPIFTANGEHLVSPFVGPPALKQPWGLRKWSTGPLQLSINSMAAEFSHLEIWCAALSRDGKSLALGHYSGVRVWNLETGKIRWHHNVSLHRDNVVVHEKRVASVTFSPDGKRVVAAGPGLRCATGIGENLRGGLLVLDTATGKPIECFVGGKENISSNVVFTPDGTMLLGGCGDGLRAWHAEDGKHAFTLSN